MARIHQLGAAGLLIPGVFVSLYGCVSEDETPVGDTPVPEGGPDATSPTGDGGTSRDAQSDGTVADSGRDGGGDAADAARVGRVEGVVISMNESAQDPVRVDAIVVGAKVTIPGRQPVTTDEHGYFAFDGVPADTDVLVSVERASDPAGGSNLRRAWGSTHLTVRVSAGGTTQVYPRIATGCVATVDYDATEDDGGVPDDAGDLPFTTSVSMSEWCWPYSYIGEIDFQPGGIARSNNQPFVGTLRVEMVPIATPDINGRLVDGFQAVPGEGRAMVGGTPTRLETFGAVEYRLYDEATNEPLKIAANRQAHIQVEVHREPDTSGGEVYPVWSFDTTGGHWVSEGNSINSGNRTVGFKTSHLTWFAAAKAITTSTCLRGTLTGLGQGIAGGSIMAFGSDWGGATHVLPGAGGAFCVDVKANSGIELFANAYGATSLFVGSQAVSAGSAAATCGSSSACQDVGNLSLVPANGQCLRGRFVTMEVPDGGQSPVAVPVRSPITVYADVNGRSATRTGSAPILRFTPDANGEACVPVPSHTLNYDFVVEGKSCGSPDYHPSAYSSADGRGAQEDGGVDAGDAGSFGTCSTGGCIRIAQDLVLDCPN